MATSSAGEIRNELNRLTRERGQGRTVIDKDVNKTAKEAADYARSIAPVDEGDYRDSIHVEDLPDRRGMPGKRVVADDFKAHLIEYGSKHNPEFAVFARTADHVSDKT